MTMCGSSFSGGAVSVLASKAAPPCASGSTDGAGGSA
jgi:hypothetical protein